jgi:hypothetical protein
VFKGFARKSSTGWFYGLKLPLGINHLGEVVSFLLPPANTADNKHWALTLPVVDTVRELTMTYADDRKTARVLNQKGLLSATGKPFTKNMIAWIRFKHHIPCTQIRADNEFTVAEVQQMFSISRHMVYYWIGRKYIVARKMADNSFLITITPQECQKLKQMIAASYKAGTMINCPTANDPGVDKTVVPEVAKSLLA